LEVDWVENSTTQYSDRKINGKLYPHPIILNVSNFDSSQTLRGAGDSQSISVTLSDQDGAISSIYDHADIHHRPARLYLVYDDPSNFSIALDKTLLFQGEIVTPFDWGEGDRSLTFTILSKLEDAEAGFVMEEGEFPDVPDEALGKAWPLVFGQVCNMPVPQVRAPRRGYLTTGTGIHDFTVHDRLCQAVKLMCPAQNAGLVDSYTLEPNGISTRTYEESVTVDQYCLAQRAAEICTLRDLLPRQQAYETDTINVFEGYKFPQNQTINLKIDDATFTGSFSGNTFTITNRIHPKFDEIGIQPCLEVSERGYTTRYTYPINSFSLSDTGTYYIYEGTHTKALADCDSLERVRVSSGGPVEAWDYYRDMEAAGFFWAAPGSEVFVEGEDQRLFIVSLLPGTVDRVTAYRTMSDGRKLLMEVPTDYYTVYEVDYTGYEVVEIELDQPLSDIDDTWEDNIYVSFTSSVGPNPADIIEWLIEKYTDLSVDATSFADVKTYLTKYPANFYLLTQKNVLDLAQDIAYQARCELYIRNDVVYLRYLSVEPTSVRTLTESDVLLNSFQQSFRDSDQLYTTHEISWQKGGAGLRESDDVDLTVKLKYNVAKYGTKVLSDTYYTLNVFSLVRKTGTFWLIRKANAWRHIEFNLPLYHLDLDVGDCVTVQVGQFLNGTAIKCIIETMDYDPSQHTIKVGCWTPVRLGETEQFYWAWPSQQNALARWPLPGDTDGGSGQSFSVIPPASSIFYTGFGREDSYTELITGDPNPSDLDDTTPSIFCEYSNYFEPIEIDPDVNPKKIEAKRQDQINTTQDQGMEASLGGGAKSAGGSDSGSKDKKSGKCGYPADGGCGYQVYKQWHTSFVQRSGSPADYQGTDGPCGGSRTEGGGCPTISGPVWVTCQTFGAAFAASMEANRVTIKSLVYARWNPRETAISASWVKQGRAVDETTGEECLGVGNLSQGNEEGPGNTGPTQESDASGGSKPSDWAGADAY
jgi:hypothetical protein